MSKKIIKTNLKKKKKRGSIVQQARTLHALEILTATSSGEVINYNMHRENTITLHAGKIQIVRKFQNISSCGAIQEEIIGFFIKIEI